LYAGLEEGFGAQNKRRFARPGSGYIFAVPSADGVQLDKDLSDLAVLDGITILPLDGFHLILQAQFQLLQPDFF
jgi:hypothetical protein